MVKRIFMPYFVYIVQCADESLYTGYTLDIARRVDEHNTSKKGAKAIKGKLPVRLVHSEEYKDKSEALKREAEIKNWSRSQKLKLITRG